MNTQQLQLNSLTGPTTCDAPWNPVYTGLLSQFPEQVGQLRSAIAFHGAGHALIQLLSGVQGLALRMPSFSDTPHVEAIVPLSTVLPCGHLPRKPVDQLLLLCYHLASCWAEYIHNQGKHRGIAATDDTHKAYALADALTPKLREHPARIVAAGSLVVQTKLGEHWDFVEGVAKRLMHIGFVSADELVTLSQDIPRSQLAAEVLTQLSDPSLDDEIDGIQKRLA